MTHFPGAPTEFADYFLTSANFRTFRINGNPALLSTSTCSIQYLYSQETEGKQKWAVPQGHRAEDCGTKSRGGGEVLGGGTEPIPHQLGVSGGPALTQTDIVQFLACR